MPKRKRIRVKSNKLQKIVKSEGTENAKKDFFELLRRAIQNER